MCVCCWVQMWVTVCAWCTREGHGTQALECSPPPILPHSPGSTALRTVVRLQLLLVHVDDVGAHAVEEILRVRHREQQQKKG